MRIEIYILSICLIIIGCNKIDEKSNNFQNSKEVVQDFTDFLNIDNGDSILFNIQYSDCGEWGGHNERFVLTKIENNNNIRFIKDSFSNCNDLVHENLEKVEGKTEIPYDNSLNKIKLIDTSYIISKSQVNTLNKYLNEVLKVGFTEENNNGVGCILYTLYIKHDTLPARLMFINKNQKLKDDWLSLKSYFNVNK